MKLAGQKSVLTKTSGIAIFSAALLALSLVLLPQCATDARTNSPDARLSPRPTAGDEPKTWWREYYETVTLADFRSNSLFAEKIDFKAIDYARLDAAIFYVTNEIRAKYKLSFLPFAEELERAAWNHAKRMVDKNFFSHTDSTDRTRATPEDRGRLAGIANPSLAENIAETFGITYKSGRGVYPSDSKPGEFSYTYNGPFIPPHTYLSFAESVLDMWMNSSGHRANILSTSALQLGCGAYFFRDKSFYGIPKFKAVQNFQWFREIQKGPVTDILP